MDKWNPTTFYDIEHTQDQARDNPRTSDQSNVSDSPNDSYSKEQRSESVDRSRSNADPMRQPVNVYPSDFGGYVLNPYNKVDQTSEIKYGSENMAPRKQQTQAASNPYDLHGTKSSSVNTEELGRQNRTPLPDYNAKPILTHDKNVSFFGDSVTKEPHGVSRSTLDQDGLRRGSVTTLPSASGRYRRNSSHKRGIPISGTNNWSSDADTSSQAKSAPASANVPVFDSGVNNNNDSLRKQNLLKPTQGSTVDSSTTRKEEERKSSIADMASAAVLVGSSAVAGVAAAASAALLGTTTTNNGTKPAHTETTKPTDTETTTDHERMPSAWPGAPSQSQSGQSAGFHTNDRFHGESDNDRNRGFGESSVHRQNPTLYGSKDEYGHANCDNCQAINNEHITAQDFSGNHHKASPSDEDLAKGTNDIHDSKIINAHNFDNEQQLGSTHDKIDYHDTHGINLGSTDENDVTDPYHDDYMNYHSSEHGDNSMTTASISPGLTGAHHAHGVHLADMRSNDIAQPKSHLATGGTAAAIGTGSVLGAGAAIGAYHRQAINKGVLSAGSDKNDISHKIGPNPGSAGINEQYQDTYNDFPSAGSNKNDISHKMGPSLGSAGINEEYEDTYNDFPSADRNKNDISHKMGPSLGSAGINEEYQDRYNDFPSAGSNKNDISHKMRPSLGSAGINEEYQDTYNDFPSAVNNKNDISHKIGPSPGYTGINEQYQDTYNDRPSNADTLDDESHMPTRAATPPPSTRSSQMYDASNKDLDDADTTAESNDISGIYRTDAKNTTSDMITEDHPRGYYDRNNIDDVYRTNAQSATQNMDPSENPTTNTTTTSANNNITDVYRTDAHDSEQNMIAADGTKITHPSSGSVPQRETQSATHQYEPRSRVSDEEMSGERNRMSEHYGEDRGVDQDVDQGVDRDDHTKSLLTGGGIAAAVGGGIAAAVNALSGKNQHETDKLNTEDVAADHTKTSGANEPIMDDKHVANNENSSTDTDLEHIIQDKHAEDSKNLDRDIATKDPTMAAAPLNATAERNQTNTSRSIGKVGQLHLEKLPLGVQVDQEPISKGRLDNNLFPQQMHDRKVPAPSSMASQGQQKESQGVSNTVPGAGGALASRTSNKDKNQHGTSAESFSSSRAITDNIVPDVRHQNDEIKNRHHNGLENTVDSTDPSFHDNQEHMQHQPRQSSFSQGLMTKAAAGTAAVASAFRRMSITGSHGDGSPSSPDDKHSALTGKEHGRRLSDAEAFKKHTLATKNDDNAREFTKNVDTDKGTTGTEGGTAGATGFTTTTGTKNNVDDVATNTKYINKEDLGVTNNDGDPLQYTGVQQDYARIPGAYSLNTSSGHPTNNATFGESNFVKMNEQSQPMSTRDVPSGQQRRGSIQKTVGKIFRTHSGNQQHYEDNITGFS